MSAPAAITQPREAKLAARPKSRVAALAPYVLALFFALWSLRGVNHSDIVDTDAARHAMNGAFIYDMIRGGHIEHPLDFAKQYYGHLPAITMPFHPIVFPAILSAFFALFGVKILSARLAVALATGICFLLMYRLVEATVGSRLIAASAAITAFSFWKVQLVATDVMLELPAMTFALAALYCLRGICFEKSDPPLPLGRALAFTGFGAVAIWTKQHTIFVAGVPILSALLMRRWRLLRSVPLWISVAILGAAGAGWMMLWNHFQGPIGNGNNVASSPQALRFIFLKNAALYGRWIWQDLKGLPGIFAAFSLVVFSVSVYRKGWGGLGLAFYSAWIVSGALILLVLGAVDSRYLFFLVPAAIVAGYVMLWRGCSCLWDERRAIWGTVAFAVAWFVTGLFLQPEFLRGPSQAAAVVTQSGPTRVLYAGEADGNFIFAVRALDSKLETTVIPAEKLPPATFEPTALEKFCRQFGINWVIVEDVPIPHKWSGVVNAPAASMRLEQSFPLESSRTRWKAGRINIYRFTAPADPGGGILQIPVRKLDRPITVKL
jgi:hypothetical protein